MHILLSVKVPKGEIIDARRKRAIGDDINDILENTKALSFYVTEHTDAWEVNLIIVVDDPTQVAGYAEPWLARLDARVDFKVMTDSVDAGTSSSRSSS